MDKNPPIPTELPKSILIQAEEIVHGPEQANRRYGPPPVVFQEYANIFNAVNPGRVILTAVDVAYVMFSVKLGRERTSHKNDNLVDICGYTEIISQLTGINP
jgi:hypothetical protein